MAVDVKEIISKQGIDSVKKATDELERGYLVLQDYITGAKTLNDVLARSKGMGEFAKNQQQSILWEQKKQREIIKTQQLEKNIESQRIKQAQAEEVRAQKQAKRITEDSRLYAQLSKRLEELRKDAQDVGVRFGENSVQFEKASKRVVDLDAKLKAVDARLGKFGRVVGNYPGGMGSGFNGLSNSIQQLTREFPAFTFSVQTGFLALSNNIPIFFDQIKQARAEIKLLQEQGKPTQSLFKQIASSIFSWGTALSIGVTLLTVYGKEIGEFVKALFKGAKAMDKFALSQKEFQEVRRNGFKDAQTELVNLQNLYRASQNKSLADGERKKAVDELQKQYPATFKNLKDEDILAGKAGKAYQFLTQQILATSLASALSDQISQNRIRDFDNEEKRVKARIDYMKEETEIAKLRALALKATGSAGTGSSNSQGYYAQIAAAEERRAAAGKIIREANIDSEELNKRNLKYIQQIDDATKKYGVTVLGVEEDKKEASKNTDYFDLELNRAKRLADQSKIIAEDEKMEFSTRLEAAKRFGQEMLKVADLTAKKELTAENLTKDKITDINEQIKDDKVKASQEASDLIAKINDYATKKLIDSLKLGVKGQEDAEKAKIQAILDGNNSRLESIEKERSDAAKVAQELLDSGKLSRKQYDAEIFAIEKQASIERIRLEIDTIQKIIDIQKLDLEFGIGTQKELSDNEKKLSDYRIALSQAESKEKNEIRDKDLEAEKERFQQLKELGQEVFNFGKGLVEGLFSRRLEALGIENERLEKNKNLQIENVNETVASEQEKKDRIAIIESQAAQQQLAIDAKVRETKRRQAIADKAFAISQAIINGALAMTKVAAQTGILTFAFSPLIAALTAVQVAAIVAQPIPKFAKGGVMQKDGLAEYGHGQELRIDPDGRTSLTSSTPEIGFVQKGTRFISAPETKQILAKPDKRDFGGKSWDVSGIIASQDRNAKEIKKALGALATKNKRTQSRINANEWNAYLKRNGLN